MTTLAIRKQNNNKDSKAIIVYFYGHDSHWWGQKIKQSKYHPYDFLIRNGFMPIFKDHFLHTHDHEGFGKFRDSVLLLSATVNKLKQDIRL